MLLSAKWTSLVLTINSQRATATENAEWDNKNYIFSTPYRCKIQEKETFFTRVLSKLTRMRCKFYAVRMLFAN